MFGMFCMLVSLCIHNPTHPGSVSISKGLKPARGRGRPPKSAGVCGKDHRETPQRRGCKPAKESAPNEPKRPRGRPRKTESDKLKKASGKPGSVPIQGSSVSPQSQLCSPQNGEGESQSVSCDYIVIPQREEGRWSTVHS